MTKIVKQTNLTKLHSLNEYQKSFATRITFKVEMIDTFNINITYNIPTEVELIINFDPNSFNEEINKVLLGKPAEYITTHLAVMETIMETFNSHLIGVCLDKEIEDIMMKQIKVQNELNIYDKNTGFSLSKVKEPIPPKMEEIKEDFNIFHFIKEIFLRRCK
jgi:hypothetical protein